MSPHVATISQLFFFLLHHVLLSQKGKEQQECS